jgi:REP element-mobilizing transposase RayT
MRVRDGLPSLRSQSMFRRILSRMEAAKERYVRILHFSIQSNHIHMLVEANDRGRLTQGMKGFAVRVAKGLNDLLETRGSVWADRFFARSLETPREVRNALVYVVRNRTKHAGDVGFDPCSSAAYLLDGWARDMSPPVARGSPSDWPVSEATSWLLTTGWKRLGLLGAADVPSSR